MTKIISYKELANSNRAIEDRELDIKKLSGEICKRRQNYSAIIERGLADVKVESELLLQQIAIIKDKCAILKDTEKDDVEKKCKLLENSITKYLNEAGSLCLRFKNQKIKVVAFGPKSQGKSTFTCLYTGLPHSIVSVKESGNDDKTGATSMIIHAENEEPKIRVILKSQEEVLSTINYSLEALMVYDLNIPGTVDGRYTSWADFMSVMNNPGKKRKIYGDLLSLKNTAKIQNFTSNVAVLTSVFKTKIDENTRGGESDFSDVPTESKEIDIKPEDLPMYNDMQYTGKQKYMTVSLIKIFKNLGRQGMFGNFEICDTKGLSVDAGGSAHEASIIKELNEADAAFSIYMLKTGDSSQDFYEALAINIHSKDENSVKPYGFDSKHFAILNIAENGFTKYTPKVALDITKHNDVANKVYIGTFKTGEYDGKFMDAKLFADSLILDMLEAIVGSTKTNDDSLINDCNRLASEIEMNRKSLVDSLSKLVKDDDEFNIGAILPEQIEKLRIAAIEALIEEANDQKTSLSDEIESEKVINKQPNNKGKIDSFFKEGVINDVFKENNPKEKSTTYTRKEESIDEELQNIRVFKMITDENDEEMIKKQLGRCENASDAAIRYILDSKVKDKAGANVKMNGLKVTGTVETLGGYIDSVCSTLYGIIEDNINVKYSPSQSIESIVNFREEIYKKVWKALKLDGLIGDFGKVALDGNINNEIVNKWVGFYNDPIKDLQCSVIVPQQSFNVLIAYFKDMEDDNESNKKTGPIVDWKRLDDAILEAYRRYGFGKRVLEKLANEVLLKNNVIRKLFASLRNPNFTNDIMGLYAGNKAEKLMEKGIIEKTQYDKIKSKEQWDALCDAAQQLVEKRVSSLPNII